MLNLYQIKPQFQAALRPTAQKLAARGVTANQITLLAAGVSILIGGFLTIFATSAWLFWLLPIWLFVRMALNALDGMLAREFMQESALGGYLNEVGDIVADAALYLPFAFVLGGFQMGLFIWLAALTEVFGLLGKVYGFNGRRYDGFMGKPERAALFGILAIWYALAGSLNAWASLLVWLAIITMCVTCWLRLQNGLRASTQ